MKKTAMVAALFIGAIAAGPSLVQAEVMTKYVRVVNETGATVERVYISHTSISRWGADRLGDSVLRNGYNIKLSVSDGTARCRYDLRAEMTDGRFTERSGVNICGGSEWTLYTND